VEVEVDDDCSLRLDDDGTVVLVDDEVYMDDIY
jgi:hypothetical protein